MRGERATLGKSLLDVQRELKIKATYIAAIENADPTAFETPGFIAGYVRSYARYLGLDPEWAYARFCDESNFSTVHGMAASASAAKVAPEKTRGTRSEARDPLADPNALFVPRGEAMFSRIEPGAIGSVLVLLALIGGLGYGGWSVLQEVQRVQLAPVEQSPGVLAEIDPLAAAMPGATQTAMSEDAPERPSPEAFDRLYRPEALEVPVLVARDGPIATLAPDTVGTLADDPVERPLTVARGVTAPPAIAGLPAGPAAMGNGQAMPEAAPVKVVEDSAPELAIFATRPAWVRVRAADGTVLFEKILDAGERYVLPPTEEPPTLRAGNSGAVYFAVNGKTYGPAAPGAQVAKNIALSPEELTGRFALADLGADPDLADAIAVAVADAVSQAAASPDAESQ
ncbi:helix-turn-helix domain-containing protein [Rhodovulum iodosum]|nr:helix-turn-helix domain-containing protein [Rhodovulum robiginosum]